MVDKAEEAARLATDDALREEAAAHLKELEQLRSAYA
jgi:hypothetical protein